MKLTGVLIVTNLAICAGMSVSRQTEKTQLNESEKHASQQTSDDIIISLLPLKILLEYKLRNENELVSGDKFRSQEKIPFGLNKENLEPASVTPRDEHLPSGYCSDINLLKNLSSSEISTIINNSENSNDNNNNLLTKEQLQKIYDSIKDCFYVKAVNAKLWGPLWHCLNRLFLFFVFN